MPLARSATDGRKQLVPPRLSHLPWAIGKPVMSSPAAFMSSLRAMGAGNVELLLGQAFPIQGHCDLDLDLWLNYHKINSII